MVKSFKKTNGEYVDVVKHTIDILKECPYVDIHIGTDSQNVGLNTIYSICIAYRYGTRGVHYIYNRFKLPRIDDKWTKLWKEAEYSIEVAQWLSEKISVDIQIDLDYNNDKKYFSNKLIQAAKGWANALGYKVNVKPNIQIATRAADYECR